jgi:hypothetical protein
MSVMVQKRTSSRKGWTSALPSGADIVSSSYVEGARSGTEVDAITSKALNDFVQSVLDEVSDRRHGAFSFGHCRQLASVRAERGAEALPIPSARIPDRFS